MFALLAILGSLEYLPYSLQVIAINLATSIVEDVHPIPCQLERPTTPSPPCFNPGYVGNKRLSADEMARANLRPLPPSDCSSENESDFNTDDEMRCMQEEAEFDATCLAYSSASPAAQVHPSPPYCNPGYVNNNSGDESEFNAGNSVHVSSVRSGLEKLSSALNKGPTVAVDHNLNAS